MRASPTFNWLHNKVDKTLTKAEKCGGKVFTFNWGQWKQGV